MSFGTCAGCAQTQRPPKRSASPYAPVNESNHESVRYFQAYAPAVEEMYREAAYEQAYKECGGSHAIIRERGVYWYSYFALSDWPFEDFLLLTDASQSVFASGLKCVLLFQFLHKLF